MPTPRIHATKPKEIIIMSAKKHSKKTSKRRRKTGQKASIQAIAIGVIGEATIAISG